MRWSKAEVEIEIPQDAVLSGELTVLDLCADTRYSLVFDKGESKEEFISNFHGLE